MMQTGPISPDISQVFDEWFAVSVKILKTKIAKLNIHHTGDLFNSVKYETPSYNELTGKGFLVFNNYGRFVDMGVGRNYFLGNPGRVDTVKTTRTRKEWYSRIFYAQVMRLREIMQTQIGKEAAHTIVSRIEEVKDLKYAAYK